MTSIIKVNNIQNSSGTAAMTIDGSSNVTFPQNATFSNTVSGTGFDLLESLYSTSTQASVEISLPTGYTSYYLTIYSVTDTTNNLHYDLTYKLDGQSSFHTTDYTTQGKLVDLTNNQLNTNGSASSMQLMSSDSAGSGGYYFNIWLNGYGTTDVSSNMSYICSRGNTGASGTWVGGGANTVEATNNSKMVEIKYAPSTGNINKLHYRLFGVA